MQKSVTSRIAALTVVGVAGSAFASVSDINGFEDIPRLFNDFGSSTLSFSSSYSPSNGSLSVQESNYGAGGFANRHAAFFADAPGGPGTDFDYGDGFTFKTTLQVNQADNVGNVEAGFQVDLFGLGFFGVLTGPGEIAAFGGPLPFHTFGTGVYSVGDEVVLRMSYIPGGGEGDDLNPSVMVYEYNNLTTASGWVSSGPVAFGNLEFGLPSAANPGKFGIGGQINQPDATLGAVDFAFTGTMIPAPASLGLLAGGSLLAARRRR